MLTISPADEIDLGALLLDSIGVEGGKDPSESQRDFGKFAAKKACQDLGIGIGSGGQEAQPNEVGLEGVELGIPDVDQDDMHRTSFAEWLVGVYTTGPKRRPNTVLA